MLLVGLFLVLACGLCTVEHPRCYVDDAQRILGTQEIENDADGLSNEYCAQLCHARGFALAGTEDGDECYCGNSLRRAQLGEGCDASCWNTPGQTCGGSWRLSVFAVNCSGIPQPPPAATPRLVNPCVAMPYSAMPFCNASLPLEERITDAIGRMATTEKLGALGTDWPAMAGLGLRAYNWWSEATHGVDMFRVDSTTPAATNFAFPITTAMSFNRSLWRATGQHIAREARAMMNAGSAYSTFWAPVINLAREPRWGRNLECPGEDPYLSGQYASNFVRGFQEAPEAPGQLLASACCKHFVANEMEHTDQNGIVHDRQEFDATVPIQDLVDSYMASFQTCVEEGKVSGLMCSYNSVNGVPSCANDWLLRQVARGDWGFDGYITSDCDADSDVYYRHNYTKTPEESVRDVLTATTDVDCGPFVPLFVTSALKKGLVSMQLIEARLRNLFRVRFRLAHFDPQSPLNSIPLSEVCSEAGQRLARDGVTQSAVLLKNSGNALPFISRSASYAVIGPNSNLSAAIAGYYGPSSVCGNNFWTLYDAVAQYTSAPPLYAPGCPSVLSANLSLVAAAAKLAGSVDRVVLALGTDLTWAAEGLDATSIVFSRGQAALWRAVAEAARAPIVVVILTATPLDLTDLLAHPKVGAVLHAGMPSVQTLGIGDLLFGVAVPAGRTVQTVLPASYADEISIFDFNMRPGPSVWPRPDCALHPQSQCPNGTNPGRTYRFFTGHPVVPFGFGLSYTSFTYSWSAAPKEGVVLPNYFSAAMFPSLASLSAPLLSYQVRVTNTGSRDAADVVLGFLVPPGAGQNGLPLKVLFGFERVFVPAGQSVTVFLYPQLKDVLFVDAKGRREVLRGRYAVHVGIPELPSQHLVATLDAN